jgi:formylglycine-generating enzyme required for sulfatase activity
MALLKSLQRRARSGSVVTKKSAREQVGELVMRVGISTIVLLIVASVNPADTASLSSSSSPPLSIAQESLLKPNDMFKECDDCPEMVVIPAGSFAMGSPESEPVRSENEGPRHVVRFEQMFSAGKFAVTFADWDACVADGGCNAYRPDDHGWGRGRRPVINVSWDDANAYAAWLSRKTGKNYRLLSEAEREYVTVPKHFAGGRFAGFPAD